MRRAFLFTCLGFLVIVNTVLALTFEERIEAQRTIERVYNNHRIWPKENPGAKPAFEPMVPESMLQEKVADCLNCDDFKDGILDPEWGYIKPSWSETGEI